MFERTLSKVTDHDVKSLVVLQIWFLFGGCTQPLPRLTWFYVCVYMGLLICFVYRSIYVFAAVCCRGPTAAQLALALCLV
jgi:hypothetical protein